MGANTHHFVFVNTCFVTFGKAPTGYDEEQPNTCALPSSYNCKNLRKR